MGDAEEASEVAPGFYNDADSAAFVSFFVKSRKRGRPKKKKSKRGRPKKTVDNKTGKQCMVDMTVKAAPQLDAKLEKQVQASRAARKNVRARVNWDIEPHATLRNRIADSWIKKKDLYVKGETMCAFCTRTNFSRAVLGRYIPQRKKFLEGGAKEMPPPKKRGRPTHLSESVMRHICEGL